MPQKNSRKDYGAGGYYHIFNRGVEKRDIFLDEQDYKVFLGYLKFYLEVSEPLSLQDQALKCLGRVDGEKVFPSRASKNYQDQIELLAYCLMPNHFHFLVKQSTDRGIAEFMQSLILKYVLYFNKKYKRVGGLFQSRYKTVLIENESQLTYLTKYIHRNPVDILTSRSGLEKNVDLIDYKYSSYGNYLGFITQNWVKAGEILSYFKSVGHRNSYQSFVKEETDDLKLVYYEMIDLDG